MSKKSDADYWAEIGKKVERKRQYFVRTDCREYVGMAIGFRRTASQQHERYERVIATGKRRCSGCLRVLALSRFLKVKRGVRKGYILARCIACTKEFARRRWLKNRRRA